MDMSNKINSLIESFIIHRNSSITEDACTMLEHLQKLDESNTNTDQALANHYMSKIIEQNHPVKYRWLNAYCPYFTIEESKSFKGYYSESNGPTLASFFNKDSSIAESSRETSKSIQSLIYELEDRLRATNDIDEIRDIKSELQALGYFDNQNDDLDMLESTNTIVHNHNNFDGPSWHKRIMDIENKMIRTIDPEEIDFYKQQLLDLGWNPEIPYNEATQIKAKHRIESILSESNTSYPLIDISHLIEESDSNGILSEAKTGRARKKIHPVSIVLIKGNAPISNVITKVTNSEFSHAAISLDENLERLYSFDFFNKINLGGGFSMESIKSYPQENRLSVFTFFVNDEDYKKLEDRCQYLINNVKNTSYNIINLLLFPFKLIDFSNKDNMICSQFVDALMKMINIDITGIKSAKVAPNTLYIKASKNGKIYKIFDGITKDFNFKKSAAYLHKLAKTVKPINECLSLLEAYMNPIIIEARKFPIEITDDEVLLRNDIIIDYDAEYAQTHKLLMQYDKAKDINGMKYELARLYYMNYILEKNLYSNKFLKNKDKNMKTRARVLNDFNKYMKVVLSYDKQFNFSEYYESSPFYPHTIGIKKSTLHSIKDIIDYIL